MEEVIHHNQRMRVGKDDFLKNRTRLEIEAQDELLKIGKDRGWSQDDMDRIQRARDTWQKQLESEQKKNAE